MDRQKIASVVESLLFVSGDPVLIARLAGVIGISEEDVEKAIDALQETYVQNHRGLFLIRKEGSVLLASHPDYAPFVEGLVRSEREGNLSRSAIETLSIVAYRGPIGRADIDAIRGVNSSLTLRNLLLRGLIERRGNPDDSRGYLYSPSFALLETLGVADCADLPDYENLSKDERLFAVVPEGDRVSVKEKTL